MTAQEAIKRLEAKRKGAVAVLDSGFGTHQGESDIVYRSRTELCDICISSLEKQIPKKPVEIINDNECKIGARIIHKGTVAQKCPICDSFTSRSCNYCQKCGQSLDWSEENE